MREILKIIKEHFVLLLGAGLFTYGLFSFDSHYYLARTTIAGEVSSYPITTYYYYSQTSLILLTIGVIFIVIGLLKIRKEKVEN